VHIITHYVSPFIRLSIFCSLVNVGGLFISPVSQAQVTPSDSSMSGLPLPDQGPMLSKLTGVREGQWSLSFSVPFGGEAYSSFDEKGANSLGIWRMITDQLALGLYAGLSVSTEEVNINQNTEEESPSYTDTQERVSSELILSPSLKFYTYQKGPIALYFIGQTHLRFYSDGDKATTTDKEPAVGEVYSPNEDIQVRTRIGFGSEWFATPSFSLAGHIGLQLDFLRQGSLGFGLETFTSALSAQMYF
jgi:hypothetical protein